MVKEASSDFLQPYIARIENHFALNTDTQSIDPDELALSPKSKSLFLDAEPGQGFVGIVHLEKNSEGKYEIHLLPSANLGDGLPATDIKGQKLLCSKGALGKGGHNIHLQAVLELGLSNAYNQRKLLGFGIWKSGCSVKFPKALPSENGLIPDDYYIVKNAEQFQIYYVSHDYQPIEITRRSILNDALYQVIEATYAKIESGLSEDQVKREITGIIQRYHQRIKKQGLINQRDSFFSPPSEEVSKEETQSMIKHMRISSTSLNDGSTAKKGEFTGGCRYDEIYLKRMEIHLHDHLTHLNEIPRELPSTVAELILNNIADQLGEKLTHQNTLSILLPPSCSQHKLAEMAFQSNPVKGLLEYALIIGDNELLEKIGDAYPDLISEYRGIVASLVKKIIYPPFPDSNNTDLQQLRAKIIVEKIAMLNNLIAFSDDLDGLFYYVINAIFATTDRVEKITVYKDILARLVEKGVAVETIYWEHKLSSDMVIGLVEAGISPQFVLDRFLNQINFYSDNTILMNDFQEKYSYLIAQGASAEMTLSQCNAKNPWLVQFLLDNGAQADIFILAKLGYVDHLKAAIEELIIKDLLDESMRQSLMTTAVDHDQSEVIRMLCQLQWNPDLPNSQGQYPILLAGKHGKMEALIALIDSGARQDVYDDEGFSLTTWAAMKGDMTLLHQLVRAGMDLSAPDANGYTPATAAAMKGQIELLLWLRSLGVDILLPDSKGRSMEQIANDSGDVPLKNILPFFLLKFEQKSQNDTSPCFFKSGKPTGSDSDNELDWDSSIKRIDPFNSN